MKKGFTLVELLGIIALLGILLLLVYPKITNLAEKKESELSDAKIALINNAVDEYINIHLNDYPQDIGSSYCISIETLDHENLIGVDIEDVMEKYNYIKVKIGLDSNVYTILNVEDINECQNM